MLGGFGRATEVELRVEPASVWRDPGQHRGIGDLEMLTPEGDVLLRPQLADELEELLGAGVTVSLVALVFAVRSEVVLSRHDVDPDPATGQVVESSDSGGEVSRSPVAGSDRDERLECRRPGRKGGGDGECVGPTPTGADQCPFPAVFLEGLRLRREGVQAVVVNRDGVAAVSRGDLIRYVPEEFETHGVVIPVRWW